jgi:ribonuclease HII
MTHHNIFQAIAGVDEAGRGPLAGPVVAAAVILDPANTPEGLDDSKKLTAARREILFAQIIATSIVGIASASPDRIERLNIRGATLWAMCRAVKALSALPDLVLVDGRDVPAGLPCTAKAIIGGDGREACIAAASIVAKVTRDRLMKRMGQHHPGYGFERHMGYGTAFHRAALQQLGVSVHHRRAFAPVRVCLSQTDTPMIAHTDDTLI